MRARLTRDAYRLNLGLSSGSRLNAQLQPDPDGALLNISAICKTFEELLQLSGVHGLLSTTVQGAKEWNDDLAAAAAEHGVTLNFEWKDVLLRIVGASGGQDPSGGFDTYPDGVHCRGCLWWIRHYLGAWLTERVMQGPIPMYGAGDPRLVQDAAGLGQFIRDEQNADHPSFGVISAQHGAIWHKIAAYYNPHARQASGEPRVFDAYPQSFAQSMCADALWNDDVNWNIREDSSLQTWDENEPGFIGYECRHAVGHAVFYTLAAEEMGIANPTACAQIGPKSHTLSDAALQRAHDICNNAESESMRSGCITGVDHSYGLLQV